MSSITVTNSAGGDIFTSADSYRTKLDNKVDGYVGETIWRYEDVLKTLDSDLAAVRNMIEQRQALGLPVPPSWLHKQARYIDLIENTHATVDKYSKVLQEDVSRGATDTYNQAQEDALSLMDRQLPGYQENIKPFNRLNQNAAEQYMGSTYSGRTSPLPGVFNSMGPEAGQTLDREILNGISQGLHPNEVVDRASAVLTASQLSRASTIARTEMYRSYREANRRVFAQNDDVVDTWIWNAHIGEYTCAACYAMHGQEFELTEPMGTHPNCRCTQIPKTKSWADLGIDMPEDAEMQYGKEGEWQNGVFVTNRTGRRKRSGEERFAELPESEQRKILGPKKYAAYKSGDIRLSDTVVTRKNGRWGTTRSVGSLQQSLDNAEARRFRESIEREKRRVEQDRIDAIKVDDDSPTWVQDIQKIKRDTIAKHGRMTEGATREVGKIIRTQSNLDLPEGWEQAGPRRRATRKELAKSRKSQSRFGNKHRMDATTVVDAEGNYVDKFGVTKQLSKKDHKTYLKHKTDIDGFESSIRADTELLYTPQFKNPKNAARWKELKTERTAQIKEMNANPYVDTKTLLANRETIKQYDRELEALLDDADVDLTSKVMAQIKTVRPVGRNGMTHTVIKDKRFTQGSADALDDAMDMYPTDWVEKSTRHGPLTVGETGRGYYQRANPPVIMTSGTDVAGKKRTMVHEFAHRMEDVDPEMKALEKEFFDRRTDGLKPVKLSTLHKGSGYASHEITIVDDFHNTYVGKVYHGQAYELSSMGIEEILTPGAYKQSILKGDTNYPHIVEDPELLDFILGLLGGL